jgi:hypothetical protein
VSVVAKPLNSTPLKGVLDLLSRFYLGHWQEGIGKLFSFGGLGVWTLVDVIMVAIRYVGPADGSLYI